MEESKKSEGKGKGILKFTLMIVICLVIAKLLTSFVFISVLVDGDSMNNTLINGDKGITDGVFFRIFGIDRFDIVIIERENGEKIVKRVIGLPGETIRYEKGVLYINDQEVKEDFISEDEAKQTVMPSKNDVFEDTLEDDEYYVLGDNRGNSSDSRVFGPFKKSQIKGKGIMTFARCDDVSESGKCVGLSLKWPKFVK